MEPVQIRKLSYLRSSDKLSWVLNSLVLHRSNKICSNRAKCVWLSHRILKVLLFASGSEKAFHWFVLSSSPHKHFSHPSILIYQRNVMLWICPYYKKGSGIPSIQFHALNNLRCLHQGNHSRKSFADKCMRSDTPFVYNEWERQKTPIKTSNCSEPVQVVIGFTFFNPDVVSTHATLNHLNSV